MSIQDEDVAVAKISTHPRVTLADIEGSIAKRYDVNGGDAVADNGPAMGGFLPLCTLSICILVMKNGFTVIGHSAPASPENFDPEMGKKIAYDNALRQLWPLLGYALRDKLHSASGEHNTEFDGR